MRDPVHLMKAMLLLAHPDLEAGVLLPQLQNAEKKCQLILISTYITAVIAIYRENIKDIHSKCRPTGFNNYLAFKPGV